MYSKGGAAALTKLLIQTVSFAIHIIGADNVIQQLQGNVAGIQIPGISSFNDGC